MRLKCISFLVLITSFSHAAKTTPEEAKEYIVSRLQAVGGRSTTSADEGHISTNSTELGNIALSSCALSYVEQTTQNVTINAIAGQEPSYVVSVKERSVTVPLDNVITHGITAAAAFVAVHFLHTVDIPTKEHMRGKVGSGSWFDIGSTDKVEKVVAVDIPVKGSESIAGVASALRYLVGKCGGEKRSPF